MSLFTDAFSRVSTGQSEVFLLAASWAVGRAILSAASWWTTTVWGYVLAYKINQGSREQTLLKVMVVLGAPGIGAGL